jgi:hypothetical protein
MPLTTTDQIRLNSAAGHLQLGDAMDAFLASLAIKLYRTGADYP